MQRLKKCDGFNKCSLLIEKVFTLTSFYTILTPKIFLIELNGDITIMGVAISYCLLTFIEWFCNKSY